MRIEGAKPGPKGEKLTSVSMGRTVPTVSLGYEVVTKASLIFIQPPRKKKEN